MKKIFLMFFFALLMPFNLALAANLSAPTITAINSNSLVISGLTPVDSDVMIYVDNKFVGSAVVKNEGTETNNFYFSALGLLEDGEHTVKAAARDKTSYVLSNFSQSKSFKVSEEKKSNPAITKNAAEEIKSEKNISNENSVQIMDENGNLIDLDNLQLNETENINETNKNAGLKNKMRWNLAIFLLFLFAVIAWIFWVNRELSKEKELATKKEGLEKNAIDKNNNNKNLKI